MRKRVRKSWLRKFFLAAMLTIIGAVALAGGAYATFRLSIRPPDVPAYVEVRIPRSPIPQAAVEQEPPSTPDDSTFTDSNYIYDSQLPYIAEYEEPEYETIIFERTPNFFTFLIYGLDNGGNADTIMVASFNADTGEANLISFPRDTRVAAERTVGLRKLVASYSAGRRGGGGHEGGIARFKEEISTLIGFTPDFYMGINQRGFIRTIDAIGGVEVTIPFRLIYDDPYQDLHIDLAPGTRVLNGYQALHFARFRQFNRDCPYARNFSDFQRMQSQQQILHAVSRELLSARTILRLPELVQVYRENVTTNLSTLEIGWFLEMAPSLNPASFLNTYTLPIARTERRGWYEIPDADELLALVNRTINPFTRDITPEMLRIVYE